MICNANLPIFFNLCLYIFSIESGIPRLFTTSMLFIDSTATLEKDSISGFCRWAILHDTAKYTSCDIKSNAMNGKIITARNHENTRRTITVETKRNNISEASNIGSPVI